MGSTRGMMPHEQQWLAVDRGFLPLILCILRTPHSALYHKLEELTHQPWTQVCIANLWHRHVATPKGTWQRCEGHAALG